MLQGNNAIMDHNVESLARYPSTEGIIHSADSCSDTIIDNTIKQHTDDEVFINFQAGAPQ